MTNVEIVGNLVKVEFSSDTTPVFLEKKNKDYILFGKDNNYPSFVLSLYKDHPEHGAIVKAKAKYLYGKGLSITDKANTLEMAKGQSFLSAANRFEDWNSIFKKTAKSYEMFNGFCWQIIWSVGGTKCEVFFLKLSNCRVSKCGKKIMYCKAWVKEDGCPNSYPERHESYKEYPVFNPNLRFGTQIYYYKETEESTDEYGDAYPTPEYQQATINIATDVGISQFQNSLVENGMSAQGMLSLFNGEPEEAKKKDIEKLFNQKFTGPKKAGRLIFNFVNPGENAKGAEYTALTTSDLDKQFELILKTNQQKIITGHQVTNKSLFGISVEGALSDRTAIIESFEQMYNTYVEPRQQALIGEIKMIAGLVGVNLDHLEVQRLSPMGLDFFDPNVSKYLTNDEVREKLGFEIIKKGVPTQAEITNDAINTLSPLVANKVLESMTPDEIRSLVGLPPKNANPDGTPLQQGQINENLQGLTGKDWIHIKRLIREVANGKTQRDVASMMIKSAYGLTDEDINTLLGPAPQVLMGKIERFVNQLESTLMLFESYAIDENPNDEFVSEQFMGEPSVETKVLDILKGDPFILPEKIAKQLGVESELILTTIDGLLKKGLVEKGSGKLQPTDKGIDRNTPPVEVEIYTVYKYATRPDVPRAGTTRPFCKRMLELSNSGKVWTRDALDNLTNELGEDAWVYRGGFYTNPDTHETTPYCRHVWKSITRSRKKNG